MFLLMYQHHKTCDFSRGHLLSEFSIFDFFCAPVYEPKVQLGLLVSQSLGLFVLTTVQFCNSQVYFSLNLMAFRF